MTGAREPRIARAMAAIDTGSAVLYETDSDDKVEELGAHYAVGRLRVSLDNALDRLQDLLDEVAYDIETGR